VNPEDLSREIKDKLNSAVDYTAEKINSPDFKPALAFIFAILAFFALPIVGTIVALILAHWSLKNMDSKKGYGFRFAVIALYIAYSQVAFLFLVLPLILIFGFLSLPMFLS
jgi:hypothetical protein